MNELSRLPESEVDTGLREGVKELIDRYGRQDVVAMIETLGSESGAEFAQSEVYGIVQKLIPDGTITKEGTQMNVYIGRAFIHNFPDAFREVVDLLGSNKLFSNIRKEYPHIHADFTEPMDGIEKLSIYISKETA